MLFDTYIIISYIGKEDSTYDVKRSSYRKNRYCDSSSGEGALRQHFLDMGVIPGAEVTLIKYAPDGGPHGAADPRL